MHCNFEKQFGGQVQNLDHHHRNNDVALLKQELDHLKATVAAASQADLTVVELLLRENRRQHASEPYPDYVPTWIDLAQENGGVAFYCLDFASGRLQWLHSGHRLFGYDSGTEPPTLDQWLSRIAPVDRERIGRVLQDSGKNGTPVDQQFRIALPGSKAVRWIQDRASVQFDSQAKPVRIVGVHIDVTAILDAQRAVEESELRFRQTFENANVGVAHVSTSGRFVRCNPRLCQMLGRPAHELASLTFQDITHPDDLDADLGMVERLLSGKISSYTMEKRYIRPDGDILWTDLNVSLLRDTDGQPLNFVSVITDIDGRKKAQEQVQLLLGEADHRVKNLLSVVSVIVKSSARTADSVNEFEEHLSRRLTGIAASHDLLMNKAISGGELSELIRRQLGIFTEVTADRLVLCGEPVQLAPAAVHAFGMVLHELATNACKYGALSSDTGAVHISWSIEAATASLRFEWQERGGPLVTAPQTQGFGSRILQRVLSGTFGGRTNLLLEPDGARFTAHVPLQSIARDALASLPHGSE